MTAARLPQMPNIFGLFSEVKRGVRVSAEYLQRILLRKRQVEDAVEAVGKTAINTGFGDVMTDEVVVAEKPALSIVRAMQTVETVETANKIPLFNSELEVPNGSSMNDNPIAVFEGGLDNPDNQAKLRAASALEQINSIHNAQAASGPNDPFVGLR